MLLHCIPQYDDMTALFVCLSVTLICCVTVVKRISEPLLMSGGPTVLVFSMPTPFVKLLPCFVGLLLSYGHRVSCFKEEQQYYCVAVCC